MSGDLRVRNNLDGAFGTATKLATIDAHSKEAGDFTEPRRVQGKEVFFTTDGAELFDKLQASEYRWEALEDPKGLYRLFAPKERHTGKVDR